MGNLLARVLSALVLAPLALVAAYAGGWPFVAFWTLAAGVILWEWTGLAAPTERVSILLVGLPALVMAGVLAASGRLLGALVVILIGAGAVGVLAACLRRVWVVGGALYAGSMLWGPAVLRSDPDFGFTAIVFLFAVVWATDIFGYFVGRAIGGPRLWPAVSPKKTWAGAFGGALGAIVVSVGVSAYMGMSGLPAIGAIAFVLSAVAQAGDLFESAVKRYFGVKDASHIIPGHGGVMDRLDGFLAAALAAALIALARGGLETPAQSLLVW